LKNYPHPIIAREGWPFLAASAFASALLTYWLGGFLSLPFWIITGFLLQFFRDPARDVPAGANLVLAPADGRIVAVEQTEDPYLKRPSIKVSVFMNVFNVHSNRSPVDGKVEQVWYNPGKFVNADLAKASLENERNALWIKLDNGAELTCVQVAGLIVLC
jgi:phosphatidylserine decarboxylase